MAPDGEGWPGNHFGTPPRGASLDPHFPGGWNHGLTSGQAAKKGP
jgi:hypothetical protein